MKKSTLMRVLKLIIIGMELCGVLLYFGVFPALGRQMVQSFPEFANRYWPWMGLLWASGIPCFLVALLLWNVVSSVQRDEIFTFENANAFRWMAFLAVGDAVFFVAANLIYLVLGLGHPSVVLLSLGIGFVGAAIGAAAYALYLLTRKAALLQEQNDLTI